MLKVFDFNVHTLLDIVVNISFVTPFLVIKFILIQNLKGTIPSLYSRRYLLCLIEFIRVVLF